MIHLVRVIEVLKRGEEVAKPGAWKNASVLTNFLFSILLLVQGFGYGLDFGESHIETAVLFILLVVNNYVHWASSKKVGL
jgi:ferric iron reductase protein FhuF